MAYSTGNPRPLGPPVPTEKALSPQRKSFRGRHVLLEPLEISHADALFPLVSGNDNAYLWDYMPHEAFSSDDKPSFEAFISRQSSSSDPLFWAIVNPATGAAVGYCALMRIDTANRVIEVGNILFSRPLQQTPAATEAVFLLAKYAFDELGYRRFEWKCNNLNAPSKRAAERLGFVFEGVFRQHMIVKGRNRDSAWFSIVDGEWPKCKRALELWLEEGNFDEKGVQKRRLQEFREGL